MRILWVSNAMWCSTGYGVQAKFALPGFQAMGHEVLQFAFWGLQGGRLEYEDIPILPPTWENFGEDVLSSYVQEFDVDLVITLFDIWVLNRDYTRRCRPAAWAPWFPVDTQMPTVGMAYLARSADFPVVYTRHAERVMAAVGVPCTYIPHGIDATTFRPGDQAAAREALGLPAGVFLACIVAANKGFPSRKAFAEQLMAFTEFCNARPDLDPHIYLHTEQRGINNGVDLVGLVHSLGIRDRVLWANQDLQRQGVPAETMAQIYQASDVCLQATMGEGFGIPTIEAQACGCPVVTVDWAASPELTVNGVCTKPEQPFWCKHGGWWAMPSVSNITAALEEIAARSPQERAAAAADGVRFVHDNYSWGSVLMHYWHPFLTRVEAEMAERRRKGYPSTRTGSGRETLVIRGCPLDIQDEPGSMAAHAISHDIADQYALEYLPLGEGDVVVDVGAHVGIVACYIASKHPGVEVYAYEPHPTNFQRLLRNIEANRLVGRVHAYPYAVTADGRNVEIGGDLKVNSGGASIYGSTGVPVASITLPDILTKHEIKRVALLKVDCEGAEYEILNGLSAQDWAKIECLRGEFHVGPDHPDWDAVALLETCLEHLPPEKCRVMFTRV